MPWKNEVDRLVNRCILDAVKGGEQESERARAAVTDLLALAPNRVETHFHLGTADEVLGEGAAQLPASEGPATRWRFLGRLDSCARRGDRDRVRAMMEDPAFEASLATAEGRVALRAVGRLLLRDGEDERAFGYYLKHLKAVDDEGSRRDADFLLEEALRRAERYERGERNEDLALERLQRAARFAEEGGLDARSGAKVDRKVGRLHQLAGRWDEAVACYRRALKHLPVDDPYRSVLVGDLALSTLGVRGTLDLLPQAEREGRDEARQLLEEGLSEGEGRSYNAIYTLGVLHYESGAYEAAARCFAEADQLMRENRAKARIVHARSRFFLGHCLLEQGVEGEELETACRYIRKDAGPSSLDPEQKDPVFARLDEVAPDSRPRGRGEGRGDDRGESRRDGRGEDRDSEGGRGRGRGRRGRGRRDESADAPAPAAATTGGPLADARRLLEQEDPSEEDLHEALHLVDQVFKARPDFDSWFDAYRTRLEALVALNEREEALRTYERFRSKLYQRAVYDRIESLLVNPEGPVASLMDEVAYHRELVDLYEVMPGRDEKFVEHCIACAENCLERGEAADVLCALNMLQEAAHRDADEVGELLERARKAAKAKGVVAAPSAENCSAKLKAIDAPVNILVVGGDEGRKPHARSFDEAARRLGLDGSWIFTGSVPPNKSLEEIDEAAEEASAILLHDRVDAELRAEVHKIGEDLDILVREMPWVGVRGVQEELCRTVDLLLGDE